MATECCCDCCCGCCWWCCVLVCRAPTNLPRTFAVNTARIDLRIRDHTTCPTMSSLSCEPYHKGAQTNCTPWSSFDPRVAVGPVLRNWTEDWPASKAKDTGCRLKVDIRTCTPAVGTALKLTTPPCGRPAEARAADVKPAAEPARCVR